jgi:hypothetical protein
MEVKSKLVDKYDKNGSHIQLIRNRVPRDIRFELNKAKKARIHFDHIDHRYHMYHFDNYDPSYKKYAFGDPNLAQPTPVKPYGEYNIFNRVGIDMTRELDTPSVEGLFE